MRVARLFQKGCCFLVSHVYLTSSVFVKLNNCLTALATWLFKTKLLFLFRTSNIMWNELIKTGCRFDAYIEKGEYDYYLYILVGGVKVYWQTPARQKMWYDYDHRDIEYQSRSGGTIPATKKKSSSPNGIFKKYMREIFDIEVSYDLEPLFNAWSEGLYLAPIIGDSLELALFDSLLQRYCDARRIHRIT